MEKPIIYVVSDSVGETAESVVKAASSQFGGWVDMRRIAYVTEPAVIIETVQRAKEDSALIAFTIVIPELRQILIEEANRQHVLYVDIMGPMMNGLSYLFKYVPKNEPGLIHKLDDAYFKKVEAIEFAVKYDDGKDPRGLLEADVVLIGVSRTSKTPLSMYLAHKCYKVANLPLVPEVDPPEELFRVPRNRCIGLVIDPIQLNHIRRERLKSLGLTSDANYANIERIIEELEHAEAIIRKVSCPRLDVSNKAVEETANTIIDILKKRDTAK